LQKRGGLPDDLSEKDSPSGRGRGRVIVEVFEKWKADKVVGEADREVFFMRQTSAVVSSRLPAKIVHHSRGNVARAEPAAGLCEKNRLKDARMFPRLENQLCTWLQGDKSPDRLDAQVWAFSESMLKKKAGSLVVF
jgi:phage terminase large subunit-like protein